LVQWVLHQYKSFKVRSFPNYALVFVRASLAWRIYIKLDCKQV
jgi:hypothetical protein